MKYLNNIFNIFNIFNNILSIFNDDVVCNSCGIKMKYKSSHIKDNDEEVCVYECTQCKHCKIKH